LIAFTGAPKKNWRPPFALAGNAASWVETFLGTPVELIGAEELTSLPGDRHSSWPLDRCGSNNSVT
jgi:hypothetical protein